VTSQFGVLDLCRFPKDTYYYYQMLWTPKDVLHIFPPWKRDVPAGTPV
jgi:beta-galactosidase